MLHSRPISIIAMTLLGMAALCLAAGTQALARGGGGGGGHGGGGFGGGGHGGGGFGGAHMSGFARSSAPAHMGSVRVGNEARFNEAPRNFAASPELRSNGSAAAMARNNAVRTNAARTWNRNFAENWNRNWAAGERFGHNNFARNAGWYRPYGRYYGYGHYYSPFLWAGWWPWWNWGYGYGNNYAYGWPYYYDQYPAYTYDEGSVQQPVDTTQQYTAYDENAAPDETAASQTGAEYFAQAADAFSAGNYSDALRYASHAAIESPQNPRAAELMSLASFAMGNYQAAAGPAHAALAFGPPDDWNGVYSYYGDANTYTTQLRKLEAFCRENPSDAGGHFLLGYHYLLTGHPNNAGKQLSEVVKLAPQDKLAANLAKQYGGETSSPTRPAPPAAASATGV